MSEVIGWSAGLSVEVDGHGVVNHAGSAVLRLVADRTGLTGALSRVLCDPRRQVVYDRGRVLADVGVLIADGGRVLSDMATLRDQAELFGTLPSDPTVWRCLNEIDAAGRDRIAAARAAVRRRVWSLIEARHGMIPASLAAGRDLGNQIVVRLDATIQIAHSDKQGAAGTFKGTWGHHPLTSWCDNTDESLVVKLRPGNAGSNTAADHIEVVNASIAQIPSAHRRRMLFTCDGAGASTALIAHFHTLGRVHPSWDLQYSVGWDKGERERHAITLVPETAWQHVLDTCGDPRSLDKAGVVELTGLLRGSAPGDLLPSWPAALRILCRRERPHPGAQLCLLEETDGWRYQLMATNSRHKDIQFLEARHRPHARVEDRIRTAKDTGLGHLPGTGMALNQAWICAAQIGIDLLCWLRLLCLDGALARAEPKTLRYRLLHTAARLTRGQRRRKLKIPATWPYARHLAAAFHHALALPPP